MAKPAAPKALVLKNIISYFTFLLIAWGFYRLLFQLPEEIEELVVKPIVWLLPLFTIVVNKERETLESVGITLKNLFPSIYLSLALGAVFVIEALVVNFSKYGSLQFNANICD